MAGEIRPGCPHEGCPGHLEAHTKVYLEVAGEFVDPGDGREFHISHVEFAHLNDELDGKPLDLEANFEVACTEGHSFAYRFTPALMERVGLQPIGDAPRTLDKRGGI